jgi:hypothetical protein
MKPGTPNIQPSTCLRALGRRQVGIQERREAAVPVGARKPGCDTEDVVLVARATGIGEAAAPQGRVDLGDGVRDRTARSRRAVRG